MIKNDFRYIIKKILIGIGIILGISFIRSCKVSALENEYYPITEVQFPASNYSCREIGTEYEFIFDNTTYTIEYRDNGIYVNNELLSNVNANLVNSQPLNSFRCRGWSVFREVPTGTIIFMLLGNINNVITYYLDSTTNQPNAIPVRLNRLAYSKQSYINGDMLLFRSDGIRSYHNLQANQMTNNCNISSDWGLNCVSYAEVDYYGGTSAVDFRVGFPNGNATANDYFYSSDFSPPVPSIVSLNAQLNKTDDNMLVSVSFSPEFSYIDTENYNYYAWFDGKQKFNLTENNVSFNTQSNTTFYVEIRDKQDNYIDSQTYTVTSIGLVYNGDYDIQFKTEEYSQSDTENNTDQIFDTINRIDIDILYIPKWVNYKYQYQYVSQNGSLTDNWVLVNDNNDKNNVVYSASLNGTMYARILDENDNVLKTETFTITRIGQLKIYDKNTDKFYGMFNIIKEQLNFGGPISDLIVIPVNVLQSISNASNKVCIPYDLGSLWGHHIVLPCIEPEHYLGSALWTLIDLIFSGCMFFAISKWFTSAYYNFILLDNTPGIKERRDLD